MFNQSLFNRNSPAANVRVLTTFLTLFVALVALTSPSCSVAATCEQAFQAGGPRSLLMPSTAKPSLAKPRQVPALFKPKADPSMREAEAVVARMLDGISERGFIANKPAPSLAITPYMNSHGMVFWYLRVFVAQSIEAAKAHSALQPDPLMQGVYLIDPSVSADIRARAPSTEAAPEAFTRLIASSPLYEIAPVRDEKGEIKKDASGAIVQTAKAVSADLIKKSLKIDELTWNNQDGESGPYIKQTGWAFPRLRGVIIQDNTIGSGTYKKARALARKLQLQGFTFTFNRNFEAGLMFARDQARLVDGKWEKDSLYLDKDNYNMMLNAYKDGRAINSEVWNEKGELVGGILSMRDGAIVSPETTYYDRENYPKISIDFAKIALLMLMDRLKAADIQFADSGMVTPFTESMRGVLVPSGDYLKMKAQEKAKAAATGAEPDLQTPWTPDEPVQSGR